MLESVPGLTELPAGSVTSELASAAGVVLDGPLPGCWGLLPGSVVVLGSLLGLFELPAGAGAFEPDSLPGPSEALVRSAAVEAASDTTVVPDEPPPG